MYIPSFNKFEDQQQVINFMQRYSFAIIITVDDGVPVATHLPFVVKQEDEKVILRSHFAKANKQGSALGNSRALVIFSEPHAYISTKNYEKQENVPTWNYITVHAYGECKMLDTTESKQELLKETIQLYEKDYLKQWDSLTMEYQQKMMNGIIAFEIIVDNLQAKKKLSQNRSEQERHNIINNLNNADNSVEKDIAAYMGGKIS